MSSSQTFYQKFSFILLINTVVIVLFVYLFPIRFESNDDAMMLLIGSGVYSGVPDPHLVFINYLYGALVSFLYTYLPYIEWYTTLFILIHIVSFSIIVWKIINTETPIIRKIIYILLFLSIEIWFLKYLQFTTTSAICALSGIILFIGDKKYQKILALLLFILASLIRFESAFLVLITCLPIGVSYFVKQCKTKSYFSIICLSLFFILPIVTKSIDSNIYNDDSEWKKYKEYNDYRGRINDNPNAQYLIDLPPHIHQSDYILFLSFFPDTGVFDNDTVKTLYADINGVKFLDKIHNIPANIQKFLFFIIILLVFGIIQYILLKDKNAKITLLTSLLLFVMLLIYISLEATLKDRVFLSIVLAFSWILFITGESIKDNKTIYGYTPILLVLAFLLIRFPIIKIRKHDRKVIETTMAQQRNLFQKLQPSDGYIIAYGASMCPEYIYPFKISETYKKNNFLGLGWLANIPFNIGKLDSYEDMIDKNLIYIHEGLFEKTFALLKNSILVHYDINVNYEIIDQEKDYMIFRLITENSD